MRDSRTSRWCTLRATTSAWTGSRPAPRDGSRSKRCVRSRCVPGNPSARAPRRAGMALAAVLTGLVVLASVALAQVEMTRGRPSTPDQDGRRKADAPADADSLGDDLAEGPESLPVVDEAGAPAVLVRIPPRYPDAALHAGIQGT